MKDSSARILLVEDDDDDCLIISRILEETSGKHRLTRVSDCREAIEELRGGQYDVVLLDYFLGKDTALELLEQMRVLPLSPPVILLTGCEEDCIGARIPVADFSDVLGKTQLTPSLLARSIRYSIDRRRSERNLKRLNRTLSVLKECSRAITGAKEESSLFEEVCRIAVEVGGYRFCWAGVADTVDPGVVSPIACAGFEEGYLQSVRAQWLEDKIGNGPVRAAVRAGQPRVIRNINSDPGFKACRAEALKRGYRSCIALPLKGRGQILGSICIYSGEPDVFDREEVKLLENLAQDLSFGIASIRDRSERTRVERALKEKVNFLKMLIDSLPNPVFYKNSNGFYEGCNKAFEEITGYRIEDLPGKTVQDVAPAETANAYSIEDSMLLEQGGAAQYESVIKGADDSSRHVIFTKAAYPDSDGKIGGIVGIIADITEQKKAERVLRSRERYFRSIISSMHEDIFVIAPDYRICDVNRDFLDTGGLEREEVVGRFCYEVLRNYKRPCKLDGGRCALDKVLRTGVPVSYTRGSTQADGTRIQLSGICSPLRDDVGQITHMINAQWDSSNEARLEMELRHAQKMEAVGTLAGGVAHDFNNILGIILGYAELTGLQFASDSKEKGYLGQIQKACMRGKELVKQILAFSRKDKQEKDVLNLSAILKEALKLLRSALPSNIEIKLSVDENAEPDLVLAVPTHMHQVIMNLCTNAAHAMEESGGLLEIGLSRIEIGGSEFAGFPDLAPGAYVHLSFRDTGTGIDPSNMERVFEPYFTTKAAGQGTGLGLAVVHGIIKDHKGAILVQSELGKGAVFHVYLPRIVLGDPNLPVDLKPVFSPGAESILVVDDEKALVDIYCQVLRSLGYRVTGKTDSMEALETIRTSPEAFDLVLTDQVMPWMTGFELAGKIWEIRPGMPVILCSGYTDLIDGNAALAAGIRAVMMKPLLLLDVAKTIREALTGAGAPY